jgi:hypothetical protein
VAPSSTSALAHKPDPAVDDLLRTCERSIRWRPADGSPPEADRLPTAVERDKLEQRRAALRGMIKPCAHDRAERGRAAAAIAEMIDSFPSTRTLPDRGGLVAGMVMDLQQFPAWAIEQACQKVKMGQAPGQSLQFCPASPFMGALIRDLLGPVGAEDRRIKAVLALVHRREVSSEEYGRVKAKFANLQAHLHASEPPRADTDVFDRANEMFRRRAHEAAGTASDWASPDLMRSNREYAEQMAGHTSSEREGT